MKDSNKRTPLHISGDSLTFESPSWEQTYSLLLKLAEDIQKSKFKPDIILGISRGGWIPARILSDLLENPNLANVKAEFYIGIGETKPEPTITQPICIPVKGKKVLIVDDLADTGKSLKLVNLYLKNHGASEVRIATIYYKPWSIITPHYYEKETHNWIVFPWELKETVKKTVETFINNGQTVKDAKEKLVSSMFDKELTEQFIKEVIGEEH
ncbi:MAG: phosphoribosyltransferase [Candidatus Bathyarchaeum sp.]|nr:MAG: phosphoribosyltransferase [Candidatus Bathyarchaeum sp.]